MVVVRVPLPLRLRQPACRCSDPNPHPPPHFPIHPAFVPISSTQLLNFLLRPEEGRASSFGVGGKGRCDLHNKTPEFRILACGLKTWIKCYDEVEGEPRAVIYIKES